MSAAPRSTTWRSVLSALRQRGTILLLWASPPIECLSSAMAKKFPCVKNRTKAAGRKTAGLALSSLTVSRPRKFTAISVPVLQRGPRHGGAGLVFFALLTLIRYYFDVVRALSSTAVGNRYCLNDGRPAVPTPAVMFHAVPALEQPVGSVCPRLRGHTAPAHWFMCESFVGFKVNASQIAVLFLPTEVKKIKLPPPRLVVVEKV